MKNFIKRNTIYILNFISIGISLIVFIFVFFSLFSMSNKPVVIHFDDINGITKIGNFSDIILIAVIGIIISSINFFISLEMKKKDIFLAKIIGVVSILFSVLLFIAFTAILTIN